MESSSSYTEKLTNEDTMKLIRARISLDKLFASKRVNIKEAWRKVAVKAGLGTDPEELRKNWANLLFKYEKLIEPKIGGDTEDGEDPASSWEYFEVLHEWALKRHDFYSPVTFSSEHGMMYLGSGQTTQRQDQSSNLPSTSSRGSPPAIISSPADTSTRKRKRDEKVDEILLAVIKRNDKSRRKIDRLTTAIHAVLKEHFNVDISLDSSTDSE